MSNPCTSCTSINDSNKGDNIDQELKRKLELIEKCDNDKKSLSTIEEEGK